MDNEDKLQTAKEYVNWFNNNRNDLVSSQIFIDYLIDEIFGVNCKDILSQFTDVDGIIEDKDVFGNHLGNITIKKCINIYGKIKRN